MELYVTPKEEFNTSRVAVLVAQLRRSPDAPAGAFQRLAAMGPEMIQSLFRRAITSWITSVQDPDWDVSLAKAKREDLIELTEKLALGRVFSLQESE